jgi:hypothetical protein
MLAALASPRIELYTMGPGDDLFSTFGHAAICVVDERAPEGRCYNYGTADFSTPLPLTWDFIRGRARFWVSTTDLRSMLSYYVHVDRTVYRQRLNLPPEQARALANGLEASTDEAVKYYRYHHFNDNCTTRIRDAIDVATAGALRGGDDGARGPTFRAWARRGFAGHWPLLAVTELLLGRPSDQPTDRWSAMFLPSELRAEVLRRFAAPPEIVYQRRAPLAPGSTWLGHLAFVLGGLALALLIIGGSRLGGAWLRVGLLPSALVLGLLAVVLDALALLSTFPELRRNEALLAFWPTDLALVGLSRAWLKRYAIVRLAAVAAIAAAHLVGLTQPLSPLALVALPLAAVLVVL